MIIDNTQLEV